MKPGGSNMSEAGDEKQQDHAPNREPNKMASLGISFLWLIGAGALAYSTHPSLPDTAVLVGHSVEGEPANAEQPAVRTASTTTTVAASPTFDFIVKFHKGDADLDHCARMFREDKEQAKAIFQKWAENSDTFKDVRLKKVGYSGEMIVIWETGLQRPLSQTDVETKLEQIKSSPRVKYVDKDSQITAQAGTGK